MSSLDLRDVQEAGRIADQKPTREGKLGDGMVATFIQATGSVREALTTLEDLADLWVSLVHLEELVGVQVGVLVI